MRVRLLGTAAGGGFPQWNCNCANCRRARSEEPGVRPRLQTSVALSADGVRWLLLNASPDVARQVESFGPLLPTGARGTRIGGIALTNADLDHSLGLFVLREGDRLTVHATAAVRRALADDLRMETILSRYCGIAWREPPTVLTPLCWPDGTPSGIRYAAFPVPGKLPRYREGGQPSADDAIGYRFVDETSGGRLVFAPNFAALDDRLMQELETADACLVDGTFWSDDEMSTAGVGSTTAREMGHLPVGGPTGSLSRIAGLPARHKIYVHVNNTNPLLVDDSPQRRAVEAAGMSVGYDGMEFEF